jgi:hypothetical protein
MSIGKIVNSFSGAFNQVVNVAFRVFGDNTAQNDLVTYLNNNDSLNTGKQMGWFARKFFNF